MPKMSPEKTIRVQEKRQQAVAARRAGYSYERIAKVVGYAGKAGAFQAVKAGLQDALHDAGSEEIRTLELTRLDEMQSGLWNEARTGDHGAVDRVLKIMERRARLLGLDSPVPVHVTGTMEHKHAHLVIDGSSHGLADILGAFSEVRGEHPALAGLREIQTALVAEPPLDELHPRLPYTDSEARDVSQP